MKARGPIAFVVVVGVVAGCGSEGGNEGAASQEPATQLEIAVAGDGSHEHWSLTCSPSGGDHPDPEAACSALAQHADSLRPVPADTACTQIYGGPQTATVEGTIDGKPFEGSFDRRNGCEIARWESLQPLLVVRGGA